MIHRCRSLALLLALAALPAFAADDDPKAEAAGYVESAKPLLARGGYFDAIANLRKAVAADPANAEAAMLLAGALRDTGEYAKAALVLLPFQDSAPANTLRAEILMYRGDDAGAEAAARRALELSPLSLGALVVIARVEEETGRREQAIATYEEVNRRWAKSSDAEETDDMLLADARARRAIFRISAEHSRDLNSIIDRLEKVWRRSPDRIDAIVEVGDLYLAGYRDQDAKKWFSRALERNPNYAPALFGRARQLAFRYDEEEAAQICEEQILREDKNPSYVPAILFVAHRALGDGDYDKASGLVAKALAVNPNDTEARATQAALTYLTAGPAKFESTVKEILARNRYASQVYAVVGRVVEEQRRFDEALELAEKAVAVDPLDWDAAFLAGRNALNVGDDERAAKHLRAAEKGDPLPNIYRSNFLKLFDQMRNFTVSKDERFVVRIPPEEAEPYLRLLKSRMLASIELLERKWGFRTKDPLYVSVFARQEDFATRTIGLPGFPALGACFGQVVTLDSPRALPPGGFLWNSCQHHELAHVVTLQLSKGRVPRWLTEGASVYEENRMSEAWRREDERTLVDAIASDEVLTLKNINEAFRGPRVLYAYYQGGLMCEFVERDFGFPKLRDMVAAYADGSGDAEVVKRVLGIEAKEFDRRFLAYAKELVAPYKVMRRPSKARCDRLKLAMRKTPNDVEGWFLLAEGALGRGDVPGALSALANAAKLAPDDGRLPALRAMAAWREQKEDAAVRHAEEAIAKGADYFELRMGLAAHHARPGGDAERAKAHWRRAIELFPRQGGPDDPRLLLAKQLGAEGESTLPEVTALLRAHTDVDEEDVGTRKQLATIYAQHGKPDDELLMFEQILDIVPLPNVSPQWGRRVWPRDEALALHERLNEMYMERKRYAEAELHAACAVGVARMDLGTTKGANAVPDAATIADLLARQAQALALLGRTADAKARAEEALRLDAENENARKLLDPQ